ncbi:MAG: hypothetical protein KDB06_15490 [Ilumatobacter sp.]|nr:hypothetical protein [Ilumatobacter sp.]MCB9380945.1 hypothetical protein [Acidimicrobiaceae bacterium]
MGVMTRALVGLVLVGVCVPACSSDRSGVKTPVERTTAATIGTEAVPASSATPSTTVATVVSSTLSPSTTSATLPPPTTPAPNPLDLSQPILPTQFTPEPDRGCIAAVSSDLGEPWMVECYQGWASGGSRAYYDDCMDCEALTMLGLQGGRWTEIGSCHAYVVAGCGLPDVVPSDVLCVLWWPNAELGELWRTGCAPRQSDITKVQTESCADYYEAYFDDVWASSLTCLKGETVRQAQEALRRIGYDIEADGYFGRRVCREFG